MLEILLFPLELFVTIVTYGAMGMFVLCVLGLFIIHFVLKNFLKNIKS